MCTLMTMSRPEFWSLQLGSKDSMTQIELAKKKKKELIPFPDAEHFFALPYKIHSAIVTHKAPYHIVILQQTQSPQNRNYILWVP